MVADVGPCADDLRDAGENILFRGGPGAMLDIDSVPSFVTSSNHDRRWCRRPAPASARGSRLHPGHDQAYATGSVRVPFRRNFSDDVGKRLAERGDESVPPPVARDGAAGSNAVAPSGRWCR